MKNFMKVLVALVLIISIGLVVSCKKKEEVAAAPEKIIVKTMGYGDNAQQEGLSWRRIVDAFEKENPNIDIQDELLFEEAYHQKVVARLASGDVPDLAYMGADARWGAPWIEAGEQFDHTPYMDKSYYDMNIVPSMGPNGEVFEVPLGTSNITTVLYMNEVLVKGLGFSAPKTYKDLVAMVPAAKAAGLEVIAIGGADGWVWGSCFMSGVISRMSGDPQWISKAVAGKNKFTDQAFVDSLAIISTMIKDGVISEKAVLTDNGTAMTNYNNRKALFQVMGQWAAGNIDPAVQEETQMLPFPAFPGEKSGAAGSVAAAISVGYGVTKSGASNPAVRDAALKFIQFFYSHPEVEQRLRDGAIVAPLLKNFKVPDDLPTIVKRKVALAQSVSYSEVIDSYLTGAPNDALNTGMQKIASGQSTAKEIAAEVEALARK